MFPMTAVPEVTMKGLLEPARALSMALTAARSMRHASSMDAPLCTKAVWMTASAARHPISQSAVALQTGQC